MRTRTLTMVCLLAAVGGAHAEQPDAVWTRKETRLRARPGETAPIVVRADKGEELTVVGSQGRWLRVRLGKRVGWVTRSQVDDRARPRARKRSGTAGFSGKPRADALQVSVAIDTVRGFDDPRTKANMVLDLERGDVVTVIGRGHDGWILVESSDDLVGWIPAAAVTDAGQFAGDPREAPLADPAADEQITIEVASEDERPAAARSSAVAAVTPRRRGRITGGLVAAVGAQTFAMRQTGTSEALATAAGPALGLAAGGRVRVRGDLWLGVAADGELATADLVYYTASEQSASMPTDVMAVHGRLEAAWGPSWQLAVRAGYHYGTLAVESERDEPMLIGESVAGLTVGLGAAVPVGRRFAVTAALDVMPAAAQRPTELPPGVMYAVSMRGAFARAAVAIRLPARMVGALAYRGGMATAELTDGAATPIAATRSDQSHTLTAGLGLAW